MSTLLALFLVAAPATAEPLSYSEPINLGDHAIDIGEMLETAFVRTQWTLTKENDSHYLGNLSYNGIDVQVRISKVDNVLTLTLDSVTETGCGIDCKDLGERAALGWIVSLRRNITYELTLRVRDSLQ